MNDLAEVVPPDTAAAWLHVADCRPDGSVLMGGTALAVHLRHRVSRDLDLFCHQGLDVAQVVAALKSRGPFVRTPPIDLGTLNGLFNETKVQFLVVEQATLRDPVVVANMPVGANHPSINHIVQALGYLDDVADDPLLAQSAGPNVRSEVASYWQTRQPQILSRFGADPW
ncbi:MAG: nucleotidyl transferase AbiEii/AbiGii toxin family protein [Acidimicrobiia bacterium]|nr:nucleotidyl transferase AbiEii/AbiGii toxin family protein [Acidimicrobiia bacterium]